LVRKAKSETPSWGAVAVGKAGNFTIEVDEALSGPPSWQVSLDSPAVFFSLRLTNIAVLLGIQKVLQARRGNVAENFELSDPPFSLRFHRDEPKTERYIVHLSGPAHDVRFVLDRNDAKQVAAALDEVIAELQVEETWKTARV
jgi:hypothetical protein